MFQNSPLQEYIDRACGALSSQGCSGKLVRYENKGVDSSKLCSPGQRQFSLTSSRLVSATAGAGVTRQQKQVGLVYRYTWDPGITWPDSWTIDIVESPQKALCFGVWQGSMGCSWHSIVLRVVWDPGITVIRNYESILHRECLQLPRLTWDPGI